MTFASGNKADMEKAIELLEEVKESIMNAYVRKTSLPRGKISKLMDDETWLNAEKALQLGFVDGILFDETKKSVPNEEPDETEPEESKNNSVSMMYSVSKIRNSFLQKVSAKSTGIPLEQLEKRLNLLK